MKQEYFVRGWLSFPYIAWISNTYVMARIGLLPRELDPIGCSAAPSVKPVVCCRQAMTIAAEYYLTASRLCPWE
jgi:hypothetical protein